MATIHKACLLRWLGKCKDCEEEKEKATRVQNLNIWHVHIWLECLIDSDDPSAGKKTFWCSCAREWSL